MLWRTIGGFDQRTPKAFDKRARSVNAVVQIKSTNQRLHNVPKHIVALLRAVVARLFAKPQLVWNPMLSGDIRTCQTRYQGVQPVRQATFGFLGISVVQHIRDDQTQYPVTQKFKALIVSLSGAAMRQRAVI
jgi:hypothetical protein